MKNIQKMTLSIIIIIAIIFSVISCSPELNKNTNQKDGSHNQGTNNGNNNDKNNSGTNHSSNLIDVTNLYVPVPTDFSNDKQNSKMILRTMIDQKLYQTNPNANPGWWDEQTKNITKYNVSISSKNYLWNGTSYTLTYTARSPYFFPGNKTKYTKSWTPTQLSEPLNGGSYFNSEIAKMRPQKKHVVLNGHDYVEVIMPGKNSSHLIFFDYDKTDTKIEQESNAAENHLLFEAVNKGGVWKIKPQKYYFYFIPFGNYFFKSAGSGPSVQANWIMNGWDVDLK